MSSSSPAISYIVSAFDRPNDLRVCLASLSAQRYNKHSIIVTDNADDRELEYQNKAVTESWGARYIKTNGPTCYHSAEVGAAQAVGDYLCFPSDDSYYVPFFASRMLQAAKLNDADLVFSNGIYGREPHMRYRAWETQPKLDHVDKTTFIVRRSVFTGFPRKPNVSAPCACDGYMIEELVSRGVKYIGLNDYLWVHN